MPAHSDATVRMLVPAGFDASDSSDGVPIQNDDSDVQLPSVKEILSVREERDERKRSQRHTARTVQLPLLSLGEIFAIMWELEHAARAAGVDLEANPMPAHQPTGIHLWSTDHTALCRWLAHERSRHFVCIALERVIVEEKIEAARFLLESLATGMPMARVIGVGPRRFVHFVFRSGEES